VTEGREIETGAVTVIIILSPQKVVQTVNLKYRKTNMSKKHPPPPLTKEVPGNLN
jgi:hypothetical protein